MGKNMVTVIGLYGMSALFAADTLPEIGETVNGYELLFEPGGKGFNQAVSALRMGSDVQFATAIGNDMYGGRSRDDFRDIGFSDTTCILKNGVNTAFATVCIDRNGENIVIVHRGACDKITVGDIRKLEDKIANSAVLLLQLEIPLCAVEEALCIAKRYGVYTILNPAPAVKLSRQLLQQVDLVTPNWGEALQLTGLTGLTTCRAGQVATAIKEMGCKNVIITLGGGGAYMLDEEGTKGLIQAHTVTCVDSAGAGDTFNGAVAARISAGKGLQDSVRYAMGAAAISVSRRGVVAAIPTIREVEAFLKMFNIDEEIV